MTVTITTDDLENAHVDRDKTDDGRGHLGFDVFLKSITIHFEDENDADALAKMVLERLGATVHLLRSEAT